MFALTGCAGSEPAADESSAAATARAPEDVEASALEGHALTIDERIDIKALSGGARLGETRFWFFHNGSRVDDFAYCDVVLEAVAGAATWIDPASYPIARVETWDNMGVDLFLKEADGSPSDFRIRCYAMTRPPLAREMQNAMKSKVTLDQTVLNGGRPSVPISQ